MSRVITEMSKNNPPDENKGNHKIPGEFSDGAGKTPYSTKYYISVEGLADVSSTFGTRASNLDELIAHIEKLIRNLINGGDWSGAVASKYLESFEELLPKLKQYPDKLRDYSKVTSDASNATVSFIEQSQSRVDNKLDPSQLD